MLAPEHIAQAESTTRFVVELLSVASLVALMAKRVRIPYTVSLVLVGIGLGFFDVLHRVNVSKDVLLLVLLPPLLFEGTLAMDVGSLRARWFEVLVLALPVTLLSFAATGWVVHEINGYSWPVALLVAAMLAPTDPVSVLAMFRSLGIPRPLAILVEGESVFNDGIGVVLFLVVLKSLEGGATAPAAIVGLFLFEVLGGLLLGAAFAYLIHRLLAEIDDHLIEVVISLVLAYSVYLLAEEAHVSGVMAVVAAGLIIGNLAKVHSMTPRTRLALSTFWEVSAYIANSLVFLLMGIALQSADLVPLAGRFALTFIGMTLARAVIVWVAGWGLAETGHAFPPPWRVTVAWSGLRGSIPIALVLGIDETGWVGSGHPSRQELLTLVSGVVLLSLVVQGLTIGPLLRRLGILGRDHGAEEIERVTADRIGAAASARKLADLRATGQVPSGIEEILSKEIESRESEAKDAQEALLLAHPDLAQAHTVELRRSLLLAERSALDLARQHGHIEDRVAEEATRKVDDALLGLRETR